MARIAGADPSQQGLFRRLFTRIIYALTKRKVGRVVMLVKIAAQHGKLLWELRPDGTIAALQPPGGRGPEGPGAIACGHARGLPFLN